jgi:uncharacterized lipoprotein YddW (UPF0748 family)
MILRFKFSSWRQLLKFLFPILFLISFITVILSSSPTRAIAPPRQEIRGVWMTINDAEILKDRTKMHEAVAQLAKLHFNTIYPVVWNSGYVMFPSTVAQRTGIQPFVYTGYQGQDILADLIAEAHRQGLIVIPWFEFGFMTPPTSELALNHPAWITQRQDGTQTWDSAAGEVVSLNPFHPQVKQFLTDLVLEIVTRYDADGIQFDDHASLPNQLGYDKYTVALYKQETKKSPHRDPQNPTWVRWRANKITTFMVSLHKAIKAVKPYFIFSVAPNPYDFAYKAHLQDWLTWVRKGIVDELIVQVYRPNLQVFLEKISRPEIQEAQKKIPTGVAILTGLRNRPVAMQQIKTQVWAARDRGLGIAFFFYESLWDYAPESIADRQAGFRALFPYPAHRAAM